MFSIMIEASWQIFLAGISLYTIAKLIYFCINLGEPKKNEYNCHNYRLDDDALFSDESDTEENLFLENALNYVDLDYKKLPKDEELSKSNEFYNIMDRRRSVTKFSSEDVPLDVIKNIIKAAGTAPSMGHTEPWKYILIKSRDMKQNIRDIVENKRALGRKCAKEYMTEAPYSILVSIQTCFEIGTKNKKNNFGYSTPISVGILLAALQYVGLVCLVTNLTTCSNEMKKLLNRPKNETIILMISVGYPAEDCKVPDLQRKTLNDLLEIV